MKTLLLFSLGLLSLASKPVDETGVSPDKILLGQACALNGAAAGLGKGIQGGLQAYFDKVNAEGGVQGRKIELKSINDGYEPDKTVMVTKALVEKVGVFSLIGAVGTPTSKVAVPIAVENEVPYLSPMTGAGFLREPFNPWVVNLRASYAQEMERQAAYYVDELGFDRIAIFYQNDSYGKAGLAGMQAALKRRGLELCGEGTYERNTVAIAGGLKSIAPSKPQAITMVGAYKSCAAFIKTAKKTPETKDSLFSNLSFVGTNNLGKELGPDSEGVIISQVVPFPWDASVPVVAEYHAAMKAAGKGGEIGFLTLEGYLGGKLFCSIANEVKGDLTRASFLASLHRVGTFDLGGITLKFSDSDHQGMDEVFLTVFKNGEITPID